MKNEELYNLAMNGNNNAVKDLNIYAGSGDAEAQYLLACVYSKLDSPFTNESLGVYWLQKSAGYKYEPAVKALKELSSDKKKKYGIETYDENVKRDSRTNAEITNIKPGGIWSFAGRIDRTTYVVYLIVYGFIFGIVLFLISQIPMEQVTEDYGSYTYDSWKQTDFAVWAQIIVGIINLYLVLALGTKRLHDCGHSGWWMILVLITAPIGPLYLLFKKGEEVANEYGPVIE